MDTSKKKKKRPKLKCQKVQCRVEEVWVMFWIEIFFFLKAVLQRGGACTRDDQSPATVVQDITHSQLLGYRYQATTYDPTPAPSPHLRPINSAHTKTHTNNPDKLTSATMHVPLRPLLIFPPIVPCGNVALRTNVASFILARPGGLKACWTLPYTVKDTDSWLCANSADILSATHL